MGVTLTSNAQWPEDLATSILLRLPVKSIIPFKCVSTTWRCFFDDPSFVSQHLCISKKNPRMLVYYLDYYENERVLRKFHDTTPATFDDWSPQFHKLGGGSFHVHDGLLYGEMSKSERWLWNPATREMRFLPEYHTGIDPRHYYNFVETIGFGSDPILNDYKVILFLQNFDTQQIPRLPRRCCGVYSMSTDSWQDLKREELELMEGKTFYNNSTNACVNGVYYWIVWDHDPYRHYSFKYYVVAFNLRKQVFELIEWPHIPHTQENTSGKMIIMPNIDRISLWISDSPRNSHTSNHDLWVLSEQGQSWTKLLTIGPLREVDELFEFWNMGKGNIKILIQFTNGKLQLYDLQTHKFVDTELTHKLSGYDFQFYTYEESLVTIRKHEENYNS